MNPRTPVVRVLSVLLLASLACGLPGATISPTPSLSDTRASPTAATAEQAGDPGPEEPAPAVLPPGDYLEALQAGVDDGTWSYEDGLLAILRAFAGQDAGALKLMEPGDREGTGVLLEAQRYVREGDDAAVRAEIESLLQVILPSIDRIRPYARPEGQASLRPRGLAAPSAEPLCEDLYKQGFPPGAGVICYVFAQELVGGLSIEVFWPSEWSSGSTEYAFAKAALEAVKDSLVYYQGLGMKAGGVQVVFTLLPLTDAENHVKPDVLASVPSAGGATSCLIPVYPLALQYYASAPIGLPGFKQTIAHEMFHCFQGWNYPEHFDEWGLQRWWGEGSADYFSNLVYPKVNKEWGRRASFVALSTELPIFYMGYENTFFFQFLEKKIQPSGLLQMFHLLPTGKPWSEHQKVLSEYPGMADYWHEFARAIVDDSLVDTGGMTIPMGDDWTDTVAILKTDDYDMPARDFVLTRYNVMLGGGLGYHVQVAETDVEVLAEVRPATTAAWTPVSIDRDTGCAHYFAIVTSTGSQSQPRTFRVDGTVDQPTGPGGACDACVVGRWRMTHTSYMNMYNAVMSDAGEAAPFSTGASGDLFLEIRDDGTLDAVADSFGVKAIGGIPDSQGDPLYTETTLNLNGKTEMTYVAMDGALVMQVVSQGISTKLVVSIAGTEFETPMGADSGGGIGSGAPGSMTPFEYTCDPAYLTLAPVLHAELYKGNVWEFQKVKP